MELSVILNTIPHEIIQEGSTSQISHITIDSREAKIGTLFICLRGLTVDGHNYINAAAKAGASAILIETSQNDYPSNTTIIKVENARLAMAHIAANYHGHPAKKLRLIGVTGTNGKTTTTHFIEEMLRMLGHKTGIIGTTGIKVGTTPLDINFATSTTPDPLELHAIFAKMVELGVQDVVMEVTSHALALYKMEGLIFEIGVFTNLTQDHLDFHGTMENYANAKGQLFEQSKFAIVNADDEYTPLMLSHNGNDPFMTYGIDNNANLQALEVEYLSNGSTFHMGEALWYLPISGKFNIYNMLATIGVALQLGGRTLEIHRIVSKMSGVPGRIQSVPNDLGVQIFVDYAHTPDGLKNIISSVREVTEGDVFTLFGCGGDRDKTKRPIMGCIAAELSDYVIITSDNPRTENPMDIIFQAELGVKKTSVKYKLCEDRKTAISDGIRMLKPGDSLIIAGKGHEDYQEIGTTKYPFSDYDIAVKVIKNLCSIN